MKKGRRLRPDELELWRKVSSTTKRLEANIATSETSIPAPEPISQAPKLALPESIPKRPTGQGKPPENNLAPPLREKMASAPLQMDRKTYGRMTRGRVAPEARLDLHGMTLDRAHGALTRFILSQQAGGKRLVLVITGKGKIRDEPGPIPVRVGVLRHQVPQWLGLPPLSQAVLQVTTAHVKHGGEGAYYVYLRKLR